MKVQDGFFGMFPAVVAVTVVEIDQPEALGLEPELLYTNRPARHNLVELFVKPLPILAVRLSGSVPRASSSAASSSAFCTASAVSAFTVGNKVRASESEKIRRSVGG